MLKDVAVVSLWIGALAQGGIPNPARSPQVTYWQERACAADARWCVEWVRILDDGRMEVGCVWRGESANRDSDDGNRKLYLVDESGRRHDHTATSDAAAYGARVDGRPGSVSTGSFFFPPPRSARGFSFHDDQRGQVISGIALDPARSTSVVASRAVLGPILAADSIAIRMAWSGLGPPTDRRFRLSRAADGFAGEVSDASDPSRYHPPRPKQPTRPLRLSGREASLFLNTLVESPLFEGQYRPTYLHTDDYPGLEIEVTSKGETFAFSSESQGADHVPWALRAKGRSWVVPSSHPARAIRIVEAIADGTPSPEARPDSEEGTDQLRIASQKGDAVQVKRLLAGGAQPDRRTPYDGETALTAAAKGGQVGAVRALLDGGADPSLPNAAGLTALRLAAEGGHPEVVKVLLGRGGQKSRSGVLLAAAQAGSVESVRAILAGWPPAGEETGQALFEAALHGSSEMIRLLLDAKAPLDAVTPEGLRPLDGAILHGHLEAARMLIAAGADLRGTPKGWPALHRAAYVGHVDMVDLLLRSGAAVDATYGPDGTTALFGAGVPAVAAALLRAGAKPNAKRANGGTPLIGLPRLAWAGWSQYKGHPWREPPQREVVGVARLLLEAGADARAGDARGLTALQAAVESLHEPSVALALLLLEHGADPNCRDAEDRTPLWRATEFYVSTASGPGAALVTPLIQALLRAGADNRPDQKGVSPLDLARRSGSAPLLELLGGLRRPEP